MLRTVELWRKLRKFAILNQNYINNLKYFSDKKHETSQAIS